MNKENKISVPVILYGVLFVIGVHFFSLSIERIIGYFMILPYNFPEPYLRLVFLFFEIIFIAKFFQKRARDPILRRRQLFNMMIFSISILLFWYVLYFTKIKSQVFFFCGMATKEEIDFFNEEFNRHKEIVVFIETIVISLSIFIYTIFRISEMPKENTKIEED